MAIEEIIEQEESPPVGEMPLDNIVMDMANVIAGNAFIGEIPYQEIKEGIKSQFQDYIGMEDVRNYVDAFYDQMEASYFVLEDEDIDNPEARREALDKIMDDFSSFICELFDKRLAITFEDYDGENDKPEELEYAVRTSYEFFILGAKDNFKNVISKDVISRLHTSPDDSNAFYEEIRSYLPLYSPLVTGVSVDQFLELAADENMIDLYQRGEVLGNFLKKYSPKLYMNEDFEVEIISYITMCQQFGRDIINGGQ